METANRPVLRCERCGQPQASGATDAGCLNCLLLDALAASGFGEAGNAHVSPVPAGGTGLLPRVSGPRCYQHYEILTHEDGSLWELGRGAMGVTYKALDVNLRVPVALKVINPQHSQSGEAHLRFLREARSAAKLRHPNVASVFHFGTIHRPSGDHEASSAPSNSEGTQECFYAMEFVEGETLEQRLRRTGPLSSRLTIEIALQISRALAAAEKRGLVHRDLKPANIMLAADAEDLGTGGRHSGLGNAWVKVIDFGLAKAVGGAAEQLGDTVLGSVTHSGFLGTPQFASPEQFAGQEVDGRSDVFSLGVVLWYLLTGELPFGGRSLAEIHDHQLHRPRPLDQLTEAHVPGSLAELLGSMLAADPANRPASAAVLHERLEQCLAALPTRPVPVRTNRSDRRRFWFQAMWLLLVAIGAAYWMQWRHARVAVAAVPATATNINSVPAIGSVATLYVTNYKNNTVGAYDATTGAALNPALVTGLSGPNGIVVSGTDLYVANETNGTIGRYHAQTGAARNAALVSGLKAATGLALAGNNLYISDDGALVTDVFNAATGAAIKVPFVDGLGDPNSVLVSGNTLYILDTAAGTVGTYNATTGAVFNATFITGLNEPYGLALASNDLYIVERRGKMVGKYNATTGAPLNATFITGLATPYDVAVYGGTLYVADYLTNSINRYDAITGALLKASFITGLDGANFLTVVPPLPIVSVKAAIAPATVGSRFSELTLKLSTPQDHDIFISFTLGGTAVSARDYVGTKTTEKIAAGKTSKTVHITPLAKTRTTATRTVELVLLPRDGYTIGPDSHAEVQINVP